MLDIKIIFSAVSKSSFNLFLIKSYIGVTALSCVLKSEDSSLLYPVNPNTSWLQLNSV